MRWFIINVLINCNQCTEQHQMTVRGDFAAPNSVGPISPKKRKDWIAVLVDWNNFIPPLWIINRPDWLIPIHVLPMGRLSKTVCALNFAFSQTTYLDHMIDN